MMEILGLIEMFSVLNFDPDSNFEQITPRIRILTGVRFLIYTIQNWVYNKTIQIITLSLIVLITLCDKYISRQNKMIFETTVFKHIKLK